MTVGYVRKGGVVRRERGISPEPRCRSSFTGPSHLLERTRPHFNGVRLLATFAGNVEDLRWDTSELDNGVIKKVQSVFDYTRPGAILHIHPVMGFWLCFVGLLMVYNCE